MDDNFSKCVSAAENVCIIVPSHLKKASDVNALIECLWTTTQQVIPVNVYLVITFDLPLIKTIFEKRFFENKDPTMHERMKRIQNHLTIIEQQVFVSTLNTIRFAINHDNLKKYEFIMFCKDHDLYDKNRTILFIQEMVRHVENRYTCIYEQINNKKNNETIHGFWQYCISKVVLHNFFSIIDQINGSEFINHPHGFLVLSTYLLVINNMFEFAAISKPLYEERKGLYININELHSFEALKQKIFSDVAVGANQEHIFAMIEAEGGDLKSNALAYYNHVTAFYDKFYN